MSVGYSRRTSRRSSRSAATRLASSSWSSASTPSLARPGSSPSSKVVVVQHLVQLDDERLAAGVGGDEAAVLLAHRARRAHPVERLVGLGVGVHRDRAVGLQHDEARRGREPRAEAALVLDRAVRHQHAHAARCSTGPCGHRAVGVRCAGSRPEEVGPHGAGDVRQRSLQDLPGPAHPLCDRRASARCSSTASTASRSRRACSRAGSRRRIGDLRGQRVRSRRSASTSSTAVFLFGFALLGLSDPVWKFSQTWVWLAIVIYIVALGLSHGVLHALGEAHGRADARDGAPGPPPGRGPAAAGGGDGGAGPEGRRGRRRSSTSPSSWSSS